jgi:outer membrane protein assembly factor BamB
LIGLADGDYLTGNIAILNAHTGQVRWRVHDPEWALAGVSDSSTVMMHCWDSYGQPMCEAHFDGRSTNHPALKPTACGACLAYVAVRVLDRATGRLRWEHAWRSAGENVDWSIALPFPSSDLQGAAAVCDDTLITGEGDSLHGFRLSDGTPQWTSPLTDLLPLDGWRINLALPHLGTHQHWLPIDIEGTRTSVLVHGATGRIVTLDCHVWTVIDHTALVRDSTHIRAFALSAG